MNAPLYRIQPYAHQLRALAWARAREHYALLMEQGTGKTPVEIHDALARWGAGEIDSVLVLAPNGVHANWVLRELPEHSPDWAQWCAAAWYASPNRAERAALEDLFTQSASRSLRWLTMNWEALTTESGLEMVDRFVRTSRRLKLVADESQKVKNPRAQRTKALMKIKPRATVRSIMSGTAILNSPWDAFSQFSFLDEMILRTTSFSAFKAEYAELLPPGHGLLRHIEQRTRGKYTPQIVARDKNGAPLWRNLDRLENLIAPHSFRVLKKDCLDLPEKIYTQRFFRMTQKQMKAYEIARKELRLALEDGTVEPIARIASLTKLSQIVSGYYIPPLGDSEHPVRIMKLEDNPKLKLLVDEVDTIVNENAEQVIIWARFRVEQRDIVEALRAAGIQSVVEYHGGVARQDRASAIDAFQSGAARVFIGQQAAGGTGITLTAASNVIYYSNTWSLEDRLQSEDRAHRIGQRNVVRYLDIVAANTIDERLSKALQRKQNLAAQVLGDNRRAIELL